MTYHEVNCELTDEVKLIFLKSHGIEIDIKDLKSLEDKISNQLNIKNTANIENIAKHYCQISLIEGLITSLIISSKLLKLFAESLINDGADNSSMTLNASITLSDFQLKHADNLKRSQVFTDMINMLKFKNFDTSSVAKN